LTDQNFIPFFGKETERKAFQMKNLQQGLPSFFRTYPFSYKITSIEILAYNRVKVIKRKTANLFEVLGVVGGLSRVVIVGAGFLVSYFS
jgi:hypothetical protein